MKLIKVKVYVNKSGGTVNYGQGYPPEWSYVKYNDFLVYDHGNTQVDANGDFEWVIACVDDAAYNEMIKNTDRCFAIDAVEAKAESDRITPKKKVINDPDKVVSIVDKLSNSQSLSVTELKSLDPNDTETGVKWAKNAEEIWRDKGILI